MTDSLYVPEKPKLNVLQKIIGYVGMAATILIFFGLIIGSFLFNKFGDTDFQVKGVLFVVGFNLIQILLFYFFLKKDSALKTDFDSNVTNAGINIPKAFGPLSTDQTKVLTRMHSYAYSMHSSFWFLIPLFLLFDLFIGIPIIRYGINIMSFMLITITLILQGAMIQYGRRHYLYYLDLINPAFHVKGECVVSKSDGLTSHITVNGVIFPLNYHQDTNILNQAYKIQSGQQLEIIYSPHSKHIWEIRTSQN